MSSLSHSFFPALGAMMVFASHTFAGACPGAKVLGEPSAGAFGTSLAAGPDYFAFGAPGDSTAGSFAGAVYVFAEVNGALVQQTKLTAMDAEPNSYFGAALACSGDTMVAGSTWDDDVAAFGGSVYVFRRSGQSWSQEAKLLPPDAVANDLFGGVVAVSGDIAAVTAPGQDAGASGAGAVYVFTRIGSAWAFSSKLVDPDPEVEGRFGYSLGVNGNWVAVGSAVTDRVRLYRKDGGNWLLETTLTAINAPPGETGFGTGLAMTDDFLAVSAIHINGHEGVLYLFKLVGDVWDFQDQQDSPDGFDLGHFGWSVSMTHDRMAIGADFSRRMFLYQRIADRWHFETYVTSGTPSQDDGFGTVVAIGSGFAAAGTPTDKNVPQGSAHVFPLSRCITPIPAIGTNGVFFLTLGLVAAGGILAARAKKLS